MNRALLALLLAVLLAACSEESATQTGSGPTQRSAQPGNEFAGQIRVSAKLGAALAVGETTELAVEAAPVAEDVAGEARVEIELARNLEVVESPGSLHIVGTSKNPVRGGPRLAGALVLALGRTERFRVLVRAVSPGNGEIAVFVTAPAPYGTAGGADYVFLAVSG